jgi:Carboxypeptidase regulatory-like domain/AhpC/TSA family
MLRAAALALVLGSILCARPADAWDITGTVVDPEGTPVPRAALWMSQDRIVQKSTADDDGTFAFQGMKSGPITIVTYVDGLGVGGVEGQLLNNEAITLYLTRPTALHLDVVDTVARPIVGARLKWLRIDDFLTLSMEDLVPLGFPAVRSDEAGTIIIPFLPAGSYAGVTVTHTRHAEAHLPSVPVGQTIPMIMVEGAKLRGRVTDSEGKGISRARVTVFRPGEDREYKFSEVLTGPEGFYSATVPPAPYFVAVKHPDYGTPAPKQAFVERDTKRLIVDITMPPGFRVSGTTVDLAHQPVKFVKIDYIIDGVVYAESTSDSAGRYQLMGNTGDAMLRITPPEGMITGSLPLVSVQVNGEPLEVPPITLFPLPSVTGSVTTRDGTPVPNALIHTSNTQPVLWTRSHDSGAFTLQLKRMQEDPVEVIAEHPTRFLRREASMDLLKPKPIHLKLRSFRPDTHKDVDGTHNPLAHMINKPAPDWACDAWFNMPDGMAEATLADLKGRVVILTLWGGFDSDGATRDRLRELNELYAALGSEQDVFFLAIHDASLEPVEVEQFVRDWDIRMPVGCDADPFLSFDAYNVNVIPQTVLIDKEGVLRYTDVDGRLHELIKVLRRD